MVAIRPIALALALLAAAPAGAGVLYKSVGKDGSITFSDLPPSTESRLLETRIVSDSGRVASEAVALHPSRGASPAMLDAERLFMTDEQIARANALVDQAERELALARRDTWSPRDGLRLSPTKFTPADEQRIRTYRSNLLAARQALMDLLRERRVAAIANPPEPGSPYVVSLTSYTRR